MCDRIFSMRQGIKKLLIGFTVILLIIAVIFPLVTPPLIENLICNFIRTKIGLPSPYAKMSLGYCWRNGPGVSGNLLIDLDKIHPSWRIAAEFGASCCEWSATVKMPKTKFDETDTTLQTLLAKYPLTAISNLTFSGTLALDAQVERTFHMPVPVWSVKIPIRNLSANLIFGNKAYAIEDLSLTASAEGLANHIDVAPIHPWAKSISASGFVLTNFSATAQLSEKTLLVTQASAGFCGGTVSLYSLILNRQNLNTGFTLFVDDVHAGEALSHINGFKGEASGHLFGKVKLFIRKGGKAIRLNNAFLYSPPGEIGKLKLSDPTPITTNLALADLDESVQNNVATALTDLDYSVLRLDLSRTDEKNATLSTTIRGTATRGNLSVPVDITLNFNGALEQLINTSLNYSTLLKGNTK